MIAGFSPHRLQAYKPLAFLSLPYISQTRFARQIWRLSCLHIALERFCSVARSSPKTTPMKRPRVLRKLRTTPLSHIVLSSQNPRLIMFSGTAHTVRGFSLPVDLSIGTTPQIADASFSATTNLHP